MKKSFFISLIAASFSLNAQAYETTHDCTIFLGIFNAGNAQFGYNITPATYNVKSTIQTAGIFGGLYPFSAEYKTTGTIKNDKLTPLSYKSNSKSRFNTRKKEMFYQDGKPTYRISTKNSSNGKKVEILPPPDNIKTSDLQTTLAQIINQYENVKFCNARLAVFDGKKRFDIVFNDEGEEYLPANEHTSFSGTAHKCSFYADDLGQNYDDLIFQLTPKNPISVWILEDEKTKRPFIAKLEKKSTSLGKLVVYTNKVNIKD